MEKVKFISADVGVSSGTLTDMRIYLEVRLWACIVMTIYHLLIYLRPIEQVLISLYTRSMKLMKFMLKLECVAHTRTTIETNDGM